MRKLILIVSMALLCILAYSQERVVKEVILGDGNTISGYVTTQTDGSYKVETPAGDVFFFSSSEVKMVREMEVKRVIEGVPGQVIVYKRGGSIRFCSNDQKLTQEDFTSIKGWREYKGAKNLRGWGYATSAIGLVAVPAACVLIDYYAIPKYSWAYYSNGDGSFREEAYYHQGFGELTQISVIVGSTLFAGGLAMIIVGNTKIKKIVKGYNNKPGYAFDFGAQQHGIGFAMTF